MRDWRLILASAKKRGLRASQVAREQGCAVSRVHQAQRETGIRISEIEFVRNETYGHFIVPPCGGDEEEWRPVVGWEGLYDVSSWGRVRNAQTGELRACAPNHSGYLVVALHRNGSRVCYRVHRIVARAFVSNPDGLPQINHRDLKKSNNRAANLEWATPKGNMEHAANAGVMRAAWVCRTKLSDADVAELRRRAREGVRHLAREFGVSPSHMCRVLKNEKRTSIASEGQR